jgi:DNA-binding NarL/FixJ family response regulator
VGVLLLTASVSDSEVFAAFHAGAHGVLLRDSAPGDLLRAVRVIAGGGALVTPRVTRRLAAEVVSHAPRGAALPELEELTQREREVLSLVGLGFSNAEIAARLAVSPSTVKTHIGSLISKLQARDRAELVMLAYETGLVRAMGQAAQHPRERRHGARRASAHRAP